MIAGSEADIGAAHVADSGKSAIEAGAQESRREVGEIGKGRLRYTKDVQTRGVNMNVRVDQTGHQNAAGAIDDLRAGGGFGAWRGDFVDDAVGDNYIGALAEGFRFAVEDACRSKDCGGHGFFESSKHSGASLAGNGYPGGGCGSVAR